MVPEMAIVLDKSLERHLPAFNWTDVRPVYRKLYFDFHLLTNPFHIQTTARTEIDLAHLITAMEVVDRYLDEMPEPGSRQKFSNSVLGFLSEETSGEDLKGLVGEPSADELTSRLGSLRTAIESRGIQTEFLATVESIFHQTELKRQATSENRFIVHLIEEWRLAGHLTVLILGSQSNQKFKKFFYPFCEMISAVDTIADIRADYKARRLKLKPGPLLYAKLFVVATRRMPKVFWRFPARWQLLKYGLPFLLNPK
jgi:hypothetical protein